MSVRAIDADELRAEYEGASGTYYPGEILADIDAAPTLELEPVIYAHWEGKMESDECSYCGFEVPISFPICKRCPCCGAKMTEGK